MRYSWLHLVLSFTLVASSAATSASHRFAQMVFPFETSRVYHFAHHPNDNSIVVEFEGTNSSELKTLDTYNEQLISRIIVREIGNESTEVKFVLRDEQVRASISHFDEPYRVVLDFYDHRFQEQKDPSTGLPIVVYQSNDHEYASKHAATAPHSATTEPSDRVEAQRPILQKSRLATTGSDPARLQADVSSIAGGTASGWRRLPHYIYRLETAPYENDRTHNQWLSSIDKDALPPAVAMADFASKLFDFGHEARALAAYQHVLHLDPQVFERSPVHLWKFAETHLAHGNLTLADGYYDAMLNKHPESDLARYAELRRLDIQAIRLINQNEEPKLTGLVAPLNKIATQNLHELVSLIAIRRAYWQTSVQGTDDIPNVNEQTYHDLARTLKLVEGQRTAFLSATLQLNHMIADEKPWNPANGEFANQYFGTYRGDSAEPYRSDLSERLRTKLQSHFDHLEQNTAYAEIINTFEQLPTALQSIRKSSRTAMILSNAYRRTGQLDRAVEFLKEVSSATDSNMERFRANFWLAGLSGKLSQDLQRTDAARSQQYSADMTAADQAMQTAWNNLAAEDQRELLTAFRANLEASITDPVKLLTPANILFGVWNSSLSTESSISGSTLADIKGSDSPSAKTVLFLRDLAQRFADLGQQQRRRDTLALMQHVRPSQMGNNDEAKQLWSQQIVTLADEYRLNNQFLEAGRMYALAGSESESWEDRAETLYKGGLLLYRAGRREEALAAFEKASQDGNNQFYANLAKERLTRLIQ